MRPAGVAIAATLALGTVLAGVPAAVADGGLDWTVTNYDNDGTHGVYLRNSSDANDVVRDAAHYVTYGSTVHLICATTGSPVGPHANPAWDQVQVTSGPNAGRVGFLNEHWVNTPVSSGQHVGGEPTCGGGGPTSQPAPPSPVGGTAAQRAAVAWARTRADASDATYYRRCLAFVNQAWAAAGVNLKSKVSGGWTGANYPYDVWPKITSGTKGQGQPPTAGALIFYNGNAGHVRDNSHVTIYIGGGRVVSTDDYGHVHVHYENFGQHPREIGWWLPA